MNGIIEKLISANIEPHLRVCGHHKNALGRGSIIRGHITNLEQSTFL
jgi:hypothetical protein